MCLSLERQTTSFGKEVYEDARVSALRQVVKGSGHWLMEEAPEQVIPELVSFLK